MAKKIDFLTLKGNVYGRLTVIAPAERVHKRVAVECLCECGNRIVVATNALRRGNTKSCGCLNRDAVHKSNYKYGSKQNPLYGRWCGIKRRCYNSKDPMFKYYGGRGIDVCDQWLKDFMAFYNWAINNGFKKELSLDRIDNNKGYSPDNCRFTTTSKQNYNRRCCVGDYTAQEIKKEYPAMSIRRLSKKYGYDRTTISAIVKELRYERH